MSTSDAAKKFSDEIEKLITNQRDEYERYLKLFIDDVGKAQRRLDALNVRITEAEQVLKSKLWDLAKKGGEQ